MVAVLGGRGANCGCHMWCSGHRTLPVVWLLFIVLKMGVGGWRGGLIVDVVLTAGSMRDCVGWCLN